VSVIVLRFPSFGRCRGENYDIQRMPLRLTIAMIMPMMADCVMRMEER
jgi:hypothetical protein